MPTQTDDFYAGVMSGTSLDGVDVAIAQFFPGQVKVHAVKFIPFADKVRQELSLRNKLELKQAMELGVKLGRIYAAAVNRALAEFRINKANIRAIGLHGQTIDHQPHGKYPYTLQIGRPDIVAYETGIATVADFRSMDIAAGGQGAPLVAAFHREIFQDPDKTRVLLNIGGIANITVLGRTTIGFDTGPGNCLSDEWIFHNLGKPKDENGRWAESGKVITELLDNMLTSGYFHKTSPKSTGREYFNLAWLEKFIRGRNYSPEDIQATLVELSAQTISRFLTAADEVTGFGGGMRNAYLIKRIEHFFGGTIKSSVQFGIDPDYMEAIAFAWLAHQRIQGRAGNIPAVTGAARKLVLGAVYLP